MKIVVWKAADKKEGMTVGELEMFVEDIRRSGIPDNTRLESVVSTWKGRLQKIATVAND